MTPAGLAQLKADEGLRLCAYPDPLTGAAPWTVGYGCTGMDDEGRAIAPGTVWTRQQAEVELAQRLARCEADLDAALPWTAALTASRRDVLINMAFNLGLNGLLGFGNTLAAIRAGRFGEAADRLLRSLWARQVGDRARRLAETMRTGK
ncbi:MAG: lysozyme [Caulobacteraceae bacterium]|nr:lysozyme [Caulobacteraceae bacterium]